MNCFFKFILSCCNCIEEEEEDPNLEAYINWDNFEVYKSREHIEVYYPEY
jgi:hypothetical protein